MASGYSVGIGPMERLDLNDLTQEQLEEMMRASDLKWESDKTPVQLYVELPFWLAMPDGELEVSHEGYTFKPSVIRSYIEIVGEATYLDSRANFLWLGPRTKLDASFWDEICRLDERPVVRPLKTVLRFEAMALADAFDAYMSNIAIRRNIANHYFYSLAYPHIPIINKLITSYRSVSYDPFAFEVGTWDVPLWWVLKDNKWVRINLMPYWDMDNFPAVATPDGKSMNIEAASLEMVQGQLNEPISPGKMELLDALSFFYRGRFGDSVRSAVTAIEVALESQLTKLLKQKGWSAEKVRRRLECTRGSFVERLADFERLSQKRLPGPILSYIPYINGIYLKNELDWVRRLRHEVVHEGHRVDPMQPGVILRAIDTMKWLFDWISLDDRYASNENTQHAFFAAVQGQRIYDFRYTDLGVVILEPAKDSSVVFIDDLIRNQFYKSLDPDAVKIELFVRMSFGALGIVAEDAPPELPEDLLLRERFRVEHSAHQYLVFCFNLPVTLESSHIARVSLRILAQSRETKRNWRALCIVNHQCHAAIQVKAIDGAIPDDVLSIASDCGIAIITAVDLMLLVRGVRELAWNKHLLADMILQHGRQGLVPPHYQRVGKYRRFFDRQETILMDLDSRCTLRIGDTIAFRLADRYFEQLVASIHVNRKAEEVASGPSEVSVKVGLRRSDLSKGQDVFVRIDPGDPNEEK